MDFGQREWVSGFLIICSKEYVGDGAKVVRTWLRAHDTNMKLTGNTMFVSGGGSGIGLAFAKRFLDRGNTVIICGRRAEVLAEVKQRYPYIHTHVCDLAEPAARENMAEWLVKEFPELNVFVNNAGI